MKVAHSIPANKTEKLVDLAIELQEFVDQAAADGESCRAPKSRWIFAAEPGWSRKTGDFGIDASGPQVLVVSNHSR